MSSEEKPWSSLDELYIEDGVTAIGDYTFYNQTKLTTVYMPDTVSCIGQYAFYGNVLLKGINPGEDGTGANLSHVSSIGDSAFFGCRSLRGQIVIATAPGVVLSKIGTGAFSNGDGSSTQNNVTSLIIGSGADNDHRATIGNNAFYNSDKMTGILLGSNLSIGTTAFYSSERLKYLEVGDNVAIGSNVFGYNYRLVRPVLGNNITLGTYAFYRSCMLDELDLTGVTSIGARAFQDTYSSSAEYKDYVLTKVTFGPDLTNIGECAFLNAQALEEIVGLEDTKITAIPARAFEHTALKAVTIPSDVTSIGNYAFCAYMSSGTDWTSGTVSGQNTTGTPIQKLTRVVIPADSKLQSIGNYAFYRQKINTDSSTATNGLVFPETLTSVGDYAFYYAGAMGNLTFNTTTDLKVGTFAFGYSGVTGLTVHAKDRFETGTYTFYSNAIEPLVIDTTGTVDIKAHAFEQHRNLSELTLLAKTITIGEQAFYLSTSTSGNDSYKTLRSVSMNNATTVSIGKEAFYNNLALEQLSMTSLTEKDNLTLSEGAFGKSKETAYYGTKTFTPKTESGETGDPITVNVPMMILLGNDDKENGPLSKFINTYNYYGGSNYTLTLQDKIYPTCTRNGQYVYEMSIDEGGTIVKFPYEVVIPALGHMYSPSEFSDANCVDGEIFEAHCIRGQVDPRAGVDDDGYAICVIEEVTGKDPKTGEDIIVVKETKEKTGLDEKGNAIYEEGYSVEACHEYEWEVVSETGTNPKLDHEYYSGTLYERNALFTEEEYEAIAEDKAKASNFFLRYSKDGGTTLINHVDYDGLSETAQAEYTAYYEGIEYLTKSEYDTLEESKQALYTEREIGRIVVDPDGGSSVVVKDGEGNVQGTYSTPFTDFTPVYMEFGCYREYDNFDLDHDYQMPYAVAYLPTNLKGKSTQQLKDIPLGINNLQWRDPEQSLAGAGGKRQFTALFYPDGDSINTFKPVEVQVTIDVERMPLLLNKITFNHLQQTTNMPKVPVQALNLPQGISSDYEVSYYLDGIAKSLTDLDEIHESTMATVRIAFTYNNGIYDLVASGSEGSYTFWKDGLYNTSGASADQVTKLASGYSIHSITRNDDDTATVVIEHTLKIAPPALDNVEVLPDDVAYDGNDHGFLMNNVPASSVITVTEWTSADDSGSAKADSSSYSLSEPAAGKDEYTDLRGVTEFSGLAKNAGTYYYKVEISNEAYESYGGTAFTTYVTIQIDKAVVEIPQPVNATFDAKTHHGYTENDYYSVGGNNEQTNAGTYVAELSLKNSENYRWAGRDEDVVTIDANWTIYKMTVAVPSVDETRRSIPYNGEYQTPLILTNIDTVADGETPQDGDYKYEFDATKKGRIVVYVYQNGNWNALYWIDNAFGLNASGSYVISGTIHGTSGLFDSENCQWPYNQTTLNLGSWAITKAEIELPSLNVPTAEYTGEPYAGTPILTGSWDSVNDDGIPAFYQDAALTFIYYSALGNPLDYPPSEVGVYKVSVDVKNTLRDSANYTLPQNTIVEGQLQIVKAQLTLEDVTETRGYLGGKFRLSAPTYLDSKGEPYEIPEGENVILRYYPAVETTDTTEEGETIIVYKIAENDQGTTDNILTDKKGEYRYFVGIDETTAHYSSNNFALIHLTVEESDQTITVEKKATEEETLPKLTPVIENVGTEEEPIEKITGYILEGHLGDEPQVLSIHGEKDVASEITIDGTIPAGDIALGGGAIQYRAKAVSGQGAEMTVAFLSTTAEDSEVTLHTDGTDNSGAATVSLKIRVVKAVPKVTVKVNETSPQTYTGSCPFTFSTTVEGKTPLDLNNIPQTAIGNPSVDGEYNNCELYFYRQDDSFDLEEMLANIETLFTMTTAPTEAGTYWVSAKYKGDSNYGQIYSYPAQFVIAPATMTITNADPQEQIYNGTAMTFLPNLVVTGVVPGEGNTPQALTRVTTSSALGSGNYMIEFYPQPQASTPNTEADTLEWTTTEPVVKDVSDSGTYWYRIVASNYGTQIFSVQMTVNKRDLTIEPTGIQTLKSYDGTDTVLHEGSGAWTVEATNAVSGEITGVNVSGKYQAGANVHTNGNLSIQYELLTGENFKTENYTVNGNEITSASYTDNASYKGSIERKQISVSGVQAVGRQYNGTASVSLNNSAATLVGVLDGETVSIISTPESGTIADIKAGNSKTVTVNWEGYKLDVDAGSNYVVTSGAAPSVDIAKRELQFSLNDQSFDYTGAAVQGYKTAELARKTDDANDTASVMQEISALVSSGLTYSFYKDSACTQSVGGVPKDKGVYYLKVTLNENDNYTAEPIVKTVSIGAVALTAVPTVYEAVYDGLSHAPASFVVTGTQEDGTLTLNAAEKGYTVKFYRTEADRTAGTNAVSGVKDVADSGSYYYIISNPNYTEVLGSVTVSITPRDLSITPDQLTLVKTYDGNTTASIVGANVGNVAASESVTVSEAKANYNDANVAAANAVTVVYTIQCANGADPANYTYSAGTSEAQAFTNTNGVYTATQIIENSDAAPVKITKKALTVTGIAGVNRSYDGTTTVALNASATALSGIIGSDDVQIDTMPTEGTVQSAGASESPKAVTVAWTETTLDGAQASNYEVTGGEDVTVIISKATPTIEWKGSLSAGYSGQPAALSYYQAVIWGKETPKEELANGANGITYTFTGKGSTAYGPSTTAPTAQGTYTVTASYEGSDNYTSLSETNDFVITEAGIFGGESMLTPVSFTYDGNAHAILSAAVVKSDIIENGQHKDLSTADGTQIFLAEVAEGETVHPDAGSDRWKLACDKGSPLSTQISVTDAGVHTYWVKITATGHEPIYQYGENNSKQLTVTVEKAQLTVGSVVKTTKVYDATTVAETSNVTISGMVNSETVTVTATSAYASKNVSATNPITTTYVLSFSGAAKAGNYSVVEDEGKTLTALENNSYSASETSTGVITQKEITVSGVDAVDRVYAKDNTVSLKGTPTSSDICSGDKVNFTLNTYGRGSISDPDAAAGSYGVKPGTYNVSVDTAMVTLSGDDASNYKISEISSPDVVISKAQLELSYGGKTSTNGSGDTGKLNDVAYNGTPLSGYNTANISSGTVSGGAAPASIVYTFWSKADCSVAAVGSDNSTAPTKAGKYYVRAEVAANDYYFGAKLVSEVNITNAALNVQITPYTGVFDNADHDIAANVSVTGIVNGTANTPITGYTVVYINADAADSAAPAADSDRWNSGVTKVKLVNDSGKYWYKVSCENFGDSFGSITVLITKKPVVKPTADTASYTYNGLEQTYTPVENADSKAFYDITNAKQKNAGSYTVNAKLKDTDNYMWADQTTADLSFTFSIAKAPLTITNNAKASRVYDGTTAAAYDGTASATVSGQQNSEDVSASVTSAVYNSKHVSGANKLTLTYTLAFTNCDASNYSYKDAEIPANGQVTAEQSATITPREVEVTGVLSTTKVYNGKTDDIDLTGGAITDDVFTADLAADEVTLTQVSTVKGTAASKDIGEQTVTVGTNAFSIGGNGKDNYTLTKVNCGKVTITAATPSFTWPETMTAEYTGSVIDEQYYTVTVNGISESDKSNGAVTYTWKNAVGTSVATPSEAGTYTVTANVAAEGNYSSFSASKTVIITDNAALPTYTVNPYGTKTYDGAQHNAVTITDVKGVNETALTNTQYTVYYSVTASDTAPSTVYTDANWSTSPAKVKSVKDSGKYWYAVVAANYQTKVDSVDVKINPAAIDFTSTLTKTKVYDQTKTAAITTPDLSGVTANDTALVSAAASAEYNSIHVAYAESIAVTYTVSFADGVDMNDYSYSGSKSITKDTSAKTWTITETVEDGVSITPAPVTVTLENQASTYDAQEPEVDQTKWQKTSGTLYSGDDLPISLAKVNGKNQGTYDLTGSNANTDYNVTFLNASGEIASAVFTINRKAITVKIGNTSGIYGDAPVLPFTLLTTEDELATTSAEIAQIRSDVGALQSDATAESAVGIYKIFTQDGSGNYGNYIITFSGENTTNPTCGNYTVNKRPITVTAENKTSAYDTDLQALTYQLSSGSSNGLVNGDTIDVQMTAYESGTSGDAITKLSHAGSYPIVIDSVSMKNGATNKTANYDITTVNVTYTITPANWSVKFTNESPVIPITYGQETENPVVITNTDSGNIASAENSNPFTGTITYTSSDEGVATVDANGAITTVAVGSTTITAVIKATASGNYASGTKTISYQLTVTAAGMNPINVTVEGTTTPYTNSTESHDLISGVTWNNPQTGGTIYFYQGEKTFDEVSAEDFDGWTTTTPSAIGSPNSTTVYTIWYKATAPNFADVINYVKAYITKPATSIIVELGTTNYTYSGSACKPTVTVRDADDPTIVYNADSYEVSYTNNVNAGTATATVTGIDGGDIEGLTASATFTITPKTITEAMISAIEDQNFTGSQLKPDITVKDSGRVTAEQTLIENTDYTVSYGQNTVPGSGNGSVTIVGKGNYTGTVILSFNILGTQLLSVDGLSDLVYTGSAQTQEITVKFGSNTLGSSDYVAVWKNNKNVGEATVSVYGIGSYAGASGEAHFNITKADQTISFAEGDAPEKNWAAGEYSNAATLKFDEGSVSYSITENSCGEGMVTFNSTTGVLTFAEGSKAGTVRVQLTYTGTGNVNSATREYKLNVKNAPVDLSFASESISVSVEGSVSNTLSADPAAALTASDHGAVSYACDDITGTVLTVDSSTGAVTLKGATGEVTVTATLAANDRYAEATASYTVTVGTSEIEYSVQGYNQVYDAAEHSITVTVTKPSGCKIEYSEDGSNWAENCPKYKNVGPYTVYYRISKTGYESVSGSADVVISKAALVSAVLSGTAPTYSGEPLEPEFTVTAEGSLTADADDYIVNYYNNINAGSAAVAVITAKADSNFQGVLPQVFTIQPKNISSANCVIPPQTYTGSPIRPELTITDGTATLTAGKDYTVDFNSNTDLTSAAVATIHGCGNYTGTKTVNFSIVKKEGITISVLVDNSAQIYDGNEKKPSILVTDNGGRVLLASEYEPAYSDNTNAGTAKVTVTGKSGSVYEGLTAEATFTIQPAEITSLTLGTGSFEYSGNECKSDLTVKSGDLTVTSYTAVYKDNVNAGTASVTVTASGNFCGSLTEEFTITPKAATPSIADIADQYHTGSKIEPKLNVTLNGTELKENVDYTVTYKNNVDIGTATAEVSLLGNYDGSNTKSFKIVASTGVLAIEEIADKTYTGSEVTLSADELKVSYNDEKLTAGTDYTATYFQNKNAGTATVSVTGKSGTAYEGLTGSRTFTILPKAIKPTIADIADQVYTGSPIKPELTVKDGNTLLKENVDYTVSYSNHTAVGTATATIALQGNYKADTGAVLSKDFKIVPNKSGLVIEGVTGKTFTGSEITQDALIVKYGGVSIPNTDYTVSYENNINAGTATVTVKGNTGTVYEGMIVSASFTINPKAISPTIADIPNQVYTGNEIKPKLTVKDDTTELTEGKDYTVEYTNNTNVGTDALARITLQGNYKAADGATLSKGFVITPNTRKLTISKPEDVVYKGSAYAPTITVKYDGNTVPADYYTVSYLNSSSNTSDLKNAGTVTVTVTGKTGTAYEGMTETTSFIIAPKEIGASGVTITADSSMVYTGSQLKPTVTAVDNQTGTDVTLASGTDYTVSYGTNVALGSSSGSVTVSGTGNYCGSVTKYFDIVDNNLLSIAAIGDQPYTGDNIEPELTVSFGSVTLNSADYVAVWKNNVNAGTATVEVTGAAGSPYTGLKASANFTIKAAEQTLLFSNGISVNVPFGQKYTNSAIAQKDADHVTITYSISGGESGVATIDSASGELTFLKEGTIIVTASASASSLGNTNAKSASYTLTVQPSGGSFTVSAGSYSGSYDAQAHGITVNNPAGADLYYGISENGPWDTAPIKYTDAGSYEVFYKAVKAGYNDIIGSAMVIINPAQLTKIVVPASLNYTGDPLTPAVTVKAGSLTVSGTDYDLTYTENVEIGTATVAATAKSGTNYSGTAVAYFSIVNGGMITPTMAFERNSISVTTSGTVSNALTTSPAAIMADVVYTSSNPGVASVDAHTGSVSINRAGSTVISAMFAGSADYNSASASYNLIVSETPIYVDQADNYVIIDRVRIDGCIVTYDGRTHTTTRSDSEVTTSQAASTTSGSAISTSRSAITVLYSVDNSQWQTDNFGFIDAGDHKVFVKVLIDGFTEAVKSVWVKINQKAITPSIDSIADQLYTGSAIRPALRVKNGAAVLREGTDYTVSYSNNINEGTATVTVSCLGNFTGTGSTTFKIVKQTQGGGGTGGGGGGGTIVPEQPKPQQIPVNGVSVDKPDHGRILADIETAETGSKVSVKPVPDDGYKLGSIVVTDSEGNPIKIEEKNGEYSFTMPEGGVLIHAEFTPDDEYKFPFVDVYPGDYAYPAIKWAHQKGITSGTTATTYSPQSACTRAYFVTFMWRLAGCPIVEGGSYGDVEANSYYEQAVIWAKSVGVTYGVTETEFCPNWIITRGQAMAMLYRYVTGLLHLNVDSASNPYRDVKSTTYYRPAIDWGFHNRITVGTTDTTFSPENQCTREQIITFIYRLYGKYLEY